MIKWLIMFQSNEYYIIESDEREKAQILAQAEEIKKGNCYQLSYVMNMHTNEVF